MLLYFIFHRSRQFRPPKEAHTTEANKQYEDYTGSLVNRTIPMIESRGFSQQMIASFFGRLGHVSTLALENQKPVTAEWYTTICLPRKEFNEKRNTNQRRRIIPHYGNAGYHTASRTIDYLNEKNVEIMTHCPYSADLSSCGFVLFPFVKKKMRGERCISPEMAVEAFKIHVSEVPSSEWKNCFDKWIERMHNCTSV